MDEFQKDKDVYENVTKVLKSLSFNDFLNFGMGDFAYVKTIVIDKQPVFAIHAANGKAISVRASHDEVVSDLEGRNLHGVTVH